MSGGSNMIFRKKVRKLMKNPAKRGKSVRNGNAPSPYTKYQKRPYVYAFKSKKVVQLHQHNSTQTHRKAA